MAGPKDTTTNGIALAPKKVANMKGFVVGIIGMGDMGKMYARRLSAAGWR